MESKIRFGNSDDTVRIAGMIGNMKQDIGISTGKTGRKKFSHSRLDFWMV